MRAPGHLAVVALGRGDVDHPPARFRRPALGQQALARAGAAEDQFVHGAKLRRLRPATASRIIAPDSVKRNPVRAIQFRGGPPL